MASEVKRRTFEKFLTSILLEECFVGDWFSKVVNHELKDGCNLGLSIAGVMGNRRILFLSVTERQ